MRTAGALALGILLAAQVGALAPLPLADLVPDGSAPTVRRFVSVDPIHAAWSIDHGLSLAAGKGVSTPHGNAKSVCALGDVDADGNDDILVRRAPGKSDDHYKFEALAGPTFERSLWKAEPKDNRLLKCGADLTDDTVSDPITVGEPVPVAAEPVPSTPFTTGEAATTTSTPLDGAQGDELAQIPVESTTGSAGAGPVEAGTEQSGTVVPAGDGALLVIDAATTGAAVSGVQDVTTSESQATVQVVDESGAVLGTIETPPLADAVAAAPTPADDEGGLPGVVLLTETEVVPVEEAPLGVPTVTLYEGDGSEQWSSQQGATAGVPVLLPDAGDVDGDGTTDLIYAVIPPEVETLPSSGYQVLSGQDGSTIIGWAPTEGGLVTALPLGDVNGDAADEVLVIAQPASGDGIVLSAQEGSGEIAWTVEVDGEATPTNTVTDPGSGNTIGFSDVTGDGVADVVVTSPSGDGIAVEVIDGTTGETVWEQTFEQADSVTAVPGGDGVGDDLVVVDIDDGLSVVGVDGATAGIEWEVGGEGDDAGAVTVAPVGDVDGDGSEDVLLTVGPAGIDGLPDPNQPGSSYIISGDSGKPLWGGSNGPEGSNEGVITLQAQGAEESRGLRDSPAGGTWVLLGVVAFVVVAGALVIRKARGSKVGE